ncbi:PEP/pyruvate-binding domain-containing protein [uncultured Desulfobacter sp.]|uniref:PEP/pyruvate-binding domain-containing protein n=1 Tax=uncultured Desulfobacter sp. TaxID=240139 RepID=UPI002AAB0DD2|nr:PEP/pyruvate-binding domain-containing protein [uncultured Desulfobacter sp.]
MQIKTITSEEWHLEGKWRICPLFISWQNEGVCKHLSDTFKTSIKLKNPTILTVNGRDSYVKANQRKKIVALLQQEASQKLSFLEHHIERCTNVISRLLDQSNQIKRTDLVNTTNQELIKIFTFFSDKFIDLMPYLMTFDYLGDVLETLVSDELKEVFARYDFPGKDFHKHLAVLTRCLDETNLIRGPHALYKIGKKMQKISRKNFQKALNNREISTLLERHTQKYAWMKVYSFLGTPFLKSDYINRLREMYHDNFADILKQKNRNACIGRQEWQTVQKIYEKEPVLIRKAGITQKFIFMRAHRFEMMNLAYCLVHNLFKEMANRVGLCDYTDLVWLLPDEIIGGLQGDSQDLVSTIRERKKGFTSFGNPKKNLILTGTLHEEIKQFFVRKDDGFGQHIKKVTGQTAFGGCVVGTVKIALTANDLKKVNRGDILIAKMTNADLVAGLEKAGAFVTDEGGILCHAAIVSREMQKPCVIGTRNATQIFQDNDKVIVNADKAEVVLYEEKNTSLKKRQKNIAIASFQQLGIADRDIAGGKGASLGELTNAGIPVPPGIVLTTRVFNNFLSENKLTSVLQFLIKDRDDFEVTSLRIRKLIEDQIFTEKYQKELLEKLQLFHSDFYAVRSSATAEDGSDNSFAGQLDTFLNVTADHVPDMVKKCWGSLFSPRALFYQKHNKIDQANVSVAVVVQKMIDAEISGIAFTANPINKNRCEMVIEAGFGLGEAIVSGQITPDDYIVSKSDLQIIHKNIQKQKEKIVRHGNDTQTEKVEKKLRGKQKLNNRHIIELARICLKIEDVYQKPMDIEWAFDGEQLFITQARPITTL